MEQIAFVNSNPRFKFMMDAYEKFQVRNESIN